MNAGAALAAIAAGGVLIWSAIEGEADLAEARTRQFLGGLAAAVLAGGAVWLACRVPGEGTGPQGGQRLPAAHGLAEVIDLFRRAA